MTQTAIAHPFRRAIVNLPDRERITAEEVHSLMPEPGGSRLL